MITDLQDQTRELLIETVPGNKSLDDRVRQLIEAEYLRQIGRYRRTDVALTTKYGMTFEEFTAGRVPRQKGYTWEVEQDAMAWETAIGGIITAKRQLKRVRRSYDR